MALQFKIGATRIYPIVNTTITERVGTFSDGTLPLELSTVKYAFLPMSKLTITDTDTNSVWNFVVISDDVETITKIGTTYYRHNLTVRSGIYEATKHLLRNTSFSQPPRKVKLKANQLVAYPQAFTTITPFFYPETESGKDNYSHIDLHTNSRVKFSRGIIKIHTDLWEYAQNDSSHNTPYHTENAHLSVKISIRRYDSGVYSGHYSISFTNDTQRYISVDDPIFQNLTNDTTFKIIFNNDEGCRFQNYYQINNGGIARINVTLELETYYYSMYDICEILYKQSCKEYNDLPSNDFAFLEMTDIDKINELKSIIAPEIIFTSSSYYDALFQLFSYIDAIPVMDENGHLSFEYLNNYDYDNLASVNTDKADERISINDEYYTNKLVANYQNGRQENAITYPSTNKCVRVNTKTIGIPTQNDYCLKVSKPIDYVEKVLIKTGTIDINVDFYYLDSGSHLLSTFKGITISEIDIADRVLEISAYESLNDNRDYYNETFLICNCLCYTRGNNYIDLLGMSAFTVLDHEIYQYVIFAELNFDLGIPSDSTIAKYDGDKVVEITNTTHIDSLIPNKQDIYYQVTYYGLFDGRTEQVSQITKYDGETYVNQENAQASLNRMGNNLQGLIAKVGNETDNVTFDVTSYGSRVKVGSLWINDDNEKFLANVVQTTFSTDINKVIVNAQFTKNFNLLSQFTKIDQQKRFYEISERLTSKGYENITEYMYFSYKEPRWFDYEISSIRQDNFLKTLIGDTLKISNYGTRADYATIVAYSYEDDLNPSTAYVYIPLHSYGFGNSICFEMDFDSQLNAGNRLVGNGQGDTPYYSKTTLYTESSGFADKMTIQIWNDGTTFNYNENFPSISSIIDNENIRLTEFKYYKKPNEIFHLNFALAFLSEEENEFFFGDRFINENAVLPNAILSKEVRFIYGNEHYSIIDNKGINSNSETATLYISVNETDGRKYVEVIIELQNTISCNSWALIDENNNMLIASNKEFKNQDVITFYVIPRRNRI